MAARGAVGIFLRRLGTRPHMEALQSVARALGHAPEELEELAQAGFTEEELEEWLYGGLLE